jgi:copper chaperone CopZ
MKIVGFILSLTLFLSACSSEPTVVHLRTEKGKKEVKIPVNANRSLTMEIKGMTCEMGCGGSIRKELKATGGVSRVEFDFVEGRKVQTAKISFDTNKITADAMVKIISTMNDKQFTIGKSSSEALETSLSTSSTSETVDSENETVELYEQSYTMPNLLNILSGFFI